MGVITEVHHLQQTMGDDWDTEAAASGLAVASSAAVVAELPEVKLFGKWSTDDVQVNDISLNDYIAVKEKYAKYLPHSAGRYQVKRFRKAMCPIVERQAVDVSPLRRVNQAIWLLCTGAREASFRNIKSIAE